MKATKLQEMAESKKTPLDQDFDDQQKLDNDKYFFERHSPAQEFSTPPHSHSTTEKKDQPTFQGSPTSAPHRGNSENSSFITDESNSTHNSNLTDTQTEVPRSEYWSYCDRCCKNMRPRTKHCNMCEACVGKFDHHCWWIGSCVGELNHRKYLLMLFFLEIEL